MICVDASVAVKWLIPEEYSQQAEALFLDCANQRIPLVGPTLLAPEVVNALWQRVRRSQLTLGEGQALLTRFLGFHVRLGDPLGLSEQAFELANTYQLPAAYDAHYLGVARLRGCPLWTDDQRLINALSGELAYVHWIGDYAGNPTP